MTRNRDSLLHRNCSPASEHGVERRPGDLCEPGDLRLTQPGLERFGRECGDCVALCLGLTTGCCSGLSVPDEFGSVGEYLFAHACIVLDNTNVA